jgi:hypothetical protein
MLKLLGDNYANNERFGETGYCISLVSLLLQHLNMEEEYWNRESR